MKQWRLRLLFVLVAYPSRVVAAQSPYTVGPNIQVSRPHSLLEVFETQIAASPDDAGRLIACAIVARHDTTDNVFYVSSDTGRTWRLTLTVPRSVDPSCTLGRRGAAYAVSIHDSMPTADSYLNVQRSADGGYTWTESKVRMDTRSVDRAYVTVGEGSDPRGAMGVIYAYRQAPRDFSGSVVPRDAVVYWSTDGFRTIDLVAYVPAANYQRPSFYPANGVSLNDGSFAGLIVELDRNKNNMTLGRSDSASAPHTANGVLRFTHSRGVGATPEITQIGDVFYDQRVPQLSMASMAVDDSRGAFRGRLYVVWPDARAEHRTQIFLTVSDDRGRTWTAPRIVSDDATGAMVNHAPNNFMPMVAVNKDGVVGISWYDRRDNENNLSYWPRFAASVDGGTTWLPSVRVSTNANTLSGTDRRLNGGDTSGLTADASGAFHALWIDNRTGVAQAWTATIVVRQR